jgi:hypothetical protein
MDWVCAIPETQQAVRSPPGHLTLHPVVEPLFADINIQALAMTRYRIVTPTIHRIALPVEEV